MRVGISGTQEPSAYASLGNNAVSCVRTMVAIVIWVILVASGHGGEEVAELGDVDCGE